MDLRTVLHQPVEQSHGPPLYGGRHRSARASCAGSAVRAVAVATVRICSERVSSNLVESIADVSWTGNLGITGGRRYNGSVHLVTYTTNATARGGWSADGQVTVDINDDGAGNYIWALHGSSPLVD